MATISGTSRPGYVWDSTDNVWYPIGTGVHTHDNSSLQTQIDQKTGYAAGKNFVINGGMDVWQRGTSFTSLSAGTNYTADRWNVYNTGTGGAITVSRVTSWLDGFSYALRMQRNSGSTSTGGSYLSMAWEGDHFVQLAGKTVTFSFYARKGANYSPTSSNWNIFLETGTNTDGFLYGGLTGGVLGINTDAVLTTGGTRYTYTFTVPTGHRAARLQMSMTPTGTASTNDWIEITGVQLEVGSVATPFSRAGGTIQGELAACQRYYYRQGGDNLYMQMGTGSGYSAANVYFWVRPPVTMRVTPTAIDYSSLAAYDNVTVVTATAAGLDASLSSKNALMVYTTHSSGITQFRPYTLVTNNSTSGYLGLSAEL